MSGETPKRELAEILAAYERGEIDVLVNAQLLAEGWNSPRATVCMHLAPTASRRVYQQRVGRVTRRHPGKEAGVVVDFVHPATKHDDPVITLHSLLDRDVYRGGAIVVGPVRRGRGRRVRVERRVIPVTAEEERRHEVFERELWRIAVEHLDYGEQHMWAALAGARVAPSGWRRARAMLHFDRTGELKRRFLLTAVERNRNAQLRVRALQEIAAAKDAEAFDLSIDVIGTWARDERREGAKVMFQALAEKRIGRRDQANAWIWRLAEYTREVHEEYAVQRWPETKRLLGLLVNSSGGAHARNARRLVHAARKQDRRLQAALLAAAVAHTPEAEEVLRGARTRLARKPSALSRELLRNFPKGKGRRSRRRRKKAAAAAAAGRAAAGAAQTRAGPDEASEDAVAATADGAGPEGAAPSGDGGDQADAGASDASPPPSPALAAHAGARTPTRAATPTDSPRPPRPTTAPATSSRSRAPTAVPQGGAGRPAPPPLRRRRQTRQPRLRPPTPAPPTSRLSPSPSPAAPASGPRPRRPTGTRPPASRRTRRLRRPSRAASSAPRFRNCAAQTASPRGSGSRGSAAADGRPRAYHRADFCGQEPHNSASCRVARPPRRTTVRGGAAAGLLPLGDAVSAAQRHQRDAEVRYRSR